MLIRTKIWEKNVIRTHEILWAFFNVFENNSMLNEKWETFLILIQSFLILIVIMRNMDDYFQ